jgi:hypothetical protein
MTIIGSNNGKNLPVPTEIQHSPLAAVLEDELKLALQFARSEKSASTRRAYRSDYLIFNKWCEARGLSALPVAPAALAAFLASEARRGIKASTIERRATGIRYAHLIAGHEAIGTPEIVTATLRGIRRTIGVAPKCKEPSQLNKSTRWYNYRPRI